MSVDHLPNEQRAELQKERRRVDFDTYDLTVDELLRRMGSGRINIAPAYQRQFRWDAGRQSRLIESVILGIPVPPLFLATTSQADSKGTWEVVDGVQRLFTLANFAAGEATRKALNLTAPPLALEGLEKLKSFEKSAFADLPEDIRASLEDRPLRVVVLNDKSDTSVRYDLFERLNTGGVTLTPQEIRECVFRGDFVDMLGSLGESSAFRTVVKFTDAQTKDGSPADYVLRFFAYLERYQEFHHSVRDFLREFVSDAAKEPKLETRRPVFEETFALLAKCFPEGIRLRRGVTSVNLFEAVAVGAALALRIDHNLQPVVNPDWLASEELRKLTTGATNSNPRVVGRIEFCRDRFLGTPVPGANE